MIGVAVIGLGNALQPHARALVDLADRVRVVWAAAISCSPRSIDTSRGFSQSTCLPAANAACAIGRCALAGVSTTTASTAGSAMARGTSVVVGNP
jgi:hypothetical protein